MSNEIVTGKWCWSTDQEGYHDLLDTEEQAIAAAEAALEDDCDIGERMRGVNSYWIAKTCNPLDLVSAERLGEYIDEQVECTMADECNAEDYILEMSKEHKTALGELVIAYIREHGSINYYSVTDVTERTYVVPEEA